ncbi:hypothetical protein BGX28_001907 [Mortierella sp. GBA30]|nr:hypothetical protein BGX28_001907 [Mortierella sp. GBA30]
MTSPIAPPAAFGPISGTALTSASPEALAKIFDTLELASLEQENFRLERAIQQLVQSNKEIEDFIELERQEQLALYRQQQEQQEQAQQGRASNGDTEKASGGGRTMNEQQPQQDKDDQTGESSVSVQVERGDQDDGVYL